MSRGNQLRVEWIDGNRFPRNKPDPRYPEGIDVNICSEGEIFCRVALPYPAPRVGLYRVTCEACGFRAVVTTAGHPDDPRSVAVPCKLEDSQNGH